MKIPKLRYHLRTRRWFAKVPDPSRRSGWRWVYFGSDEATARGRYDELLATWLAAGRDLSFLDDEDLKEPGPGEVTVVDLCARFWRDFVSRRYLKDGRPTGERHMWSTVIRYWEAVAGTVLVDRYDLTDHEAFRQSLIDRKLSRGTVQRYLKKAERIIRWCSARKLAPRGLAEELRELDPMPAGVRRTPPVKPVPRDVVDSTLEHVPAVVRDMATVQELCGMRPMEVCGLRASWIDFEPAGLPEELKGKVVVATIEGHKTEHRGKERLVVIGPKALSVVRRHLRPGRDLVFVREDGHPWETPSYRDQLYLGARRAKVPIWGPNRLRHSAATRARQGGGLELAQLLLGHSSRQTTESYAEVDLTAALRWAAANG